MALRRARDASRLSDFEPDELAVVERGLVAVGYELDDGVLMLTVSRSRICDLASLRRSRHKGTGDGLRHRVEAWREVRVPAGSNVVDGLVRVLDRQAG